MKKHGVVGHIGASFHDLELAQAFAQDPGLDGAMVRFNAVHRRAATEFFPSLPPRKKRPGVMTFNTMTSQWGPVWNKPANWTHEWTPEPADFYRYALSQPDVDVVLMGAMNRRDIDQAIAAVERGAMSKEELELCAAWGDAHRQQSQPPKLAPAARPAARAKRSPAVKRTASRRKQKA
jgi:predicted aldo/keto reductase-like oxidoreductase